MVQFNLLPDVKQEFIKTRRTKRLVILVSIAASGLALFIMLLMIVTVDVVQKKNLHDLNSDISKYSAQIKQVPDINKILTVQNQLNTLTTLHNQKVVTSRLFTFISQVTPNQASIGTLKVDYTAQTISIDGEAPSLDIVNTYVDTLKNTKYTTDVNSTSANAFSQVVLSSFGRDSKGATYTITLSFDPTIFDSASNVKLAVPSGTTNAQAQLFQKEAGN